VYSFSGLAGRSQCSAQAPSTPRRARISLTDSACAGSATSTASAATPERKLATCQALRLENLIAAPPVEKRNAAATMRSRAERAFMTGGVCIIPVTLAHPR